MNSGAGLLFFCFLFRRLHVFCKQEIITKPAFDDHRGIDGNAAFCCGRPWGHSVEPFSYIVFEEPRPAYPNGLSADYTGTACRIYKHLIHDIEIPEYIPAIVVGMIDIPADVFSDAFCVMRAGVPAIEAWGAAVAAVKFFLKYTLGSCCARKKSTDRLQQNNAPDKV